MPKNDASIVQVLVSVPNARVGTRLVKALLESRLCACAQTLGPVTSRFRWKGRIEQSRELLVLLKTRADRVTAVETEIVRLHPYEVPEILVVPVQDGHAAYLEWVRRECDGSEDGVPSA